MTRPSSERKTYVPAITPGLRKLLVFILVLTALLGANSAYLVAVTIFEAIHQQTYQNYFYQYMFLGHLVMGFALIAPFLVFGILHIRNAWQRKNRRAVWMGYYLFITCLALIASGLLLTRIGPLEIRDALARDIFYWVHMASPLGAIWLYCLHRLAGPPIKWRVGLGYLTLIAAAGLVAVTMHQSDPRSWHQEGSPEGAKYFEPSLARTSTGKFIPRRALSNDAYCKECHSDAHAAWSTSAHRFSSFNNPAYLASVRETRAFSMNREGSVRRARWCAGCHDPVPFFTGQFDDPNFDDITNPTAHAGITCTSCHAITHINSPKGNADYTIEEPLHYPFAYSTNSVLQWINRQLVKAKPSFHKKTFLKSFHKEAEFCAACHKVHLPKALNDYKWLRGQNHYDSFLLSGVSGHSARSFYYPETAQKNCNQCHMPLQASDDFGAQRQDSSTQRSIHDHTFLGANTALPYWRNDNESVGAHQEFLKDSVRVDIFGIREQGRLEGKLSAPLRPQVPTLEPGKSYLLETVIRTLTLGHHFTQGTTDSNEIWLHLQVTDADDQLIAESGAIDSNGQVDPWAHFLNTFMLDRDGNRISRRNAQDIFVPLYSHQIPPGAALTVHYRLDVPKNVGESLEIEAQLLYRKFDQGYVDYIVNQHPPDGPPLADWQIGQQVVNALPITTLASDRIKFAVGESSSTTLDHPDSAIPAWQRWNDYGIGALLKGTSELRQAEAAFEQVEKLGRYDGPLNLARVYFKEGRLDEAVAAVARSAARADPAPPPWTVAWLSGLINRQQGHLDKAEENFRSVLTLPTAEMRRRGFDFRKDYVVRNLLGQTLYDRARQLRGAEHRTAREQLLSTAIEEFQRTLVIDPENSDAHFNLQLLFGGTGNKEMENHHRKLHLKYKPDDNARDRAVAKARKKYPGANQAAEAVVIYKLHKVEGTEQ